MSARILHFPLTRMSRALYEALDAVDLLEEALVQALAERSPSALQIAALAMVANLRNKHGRQPSVMAGLTSE